MTGADDDIFPDRRCSTCYWWTEQPALATGVKRPLGADPALGCCTIRPPQVFSMMGMGVSLFPETHSLRVCGDWQRDEVLDWDEDDTGTGRGGKTVVPFPGGRPAA